MIEKLREKTAKALGIEARVVSTSLDDYYGGIFRALGDRGVTLSTWDGYKSSHSESLTWDSGEKRWKLVREWWDYEMKTDFVEDYLSEEIRGEPVGSVISKLNRFLLLRGELSDILHRSPKDIEEFVRNSMPEEVLIKRVHDRLKEWGLFPRTKTTVNGWQRVPPQTA